jgi:hypothetical protein
LSRTTHPDRDARTLESPKNPELGFTKDGYWQDRNQRPVPKSFWGTKHFMYLGRLPTSEEAALMDFWKTTNMLGRRNR